MKTYKRRLTIHVDADNVISIRAGLTQALSHLSALVLAGKVGDQKHEKQTGSSTYHIILKTPTPEPGQGDNPTLFNG